MTSKHSQLGVEDVIDLDSQIVALQRQLSRLQETRNKKTSPLCRMPEELLVRFLSHLQNTLLLEHSLDDWTATLRVCRYIRRVGLQWSKLWSTIQITTEKDLDSALRRMRCCQGPRNDSQLSLDVHLDELSPRVDSEKLKTSLKSLAPRIRELSLLTSYRWLLPSVLPLPQLQVLNIDIFDREECFSHLRACLLHSTDLVTLELRFKSASTGVWYASTDSRGGDATMIKLPRLRRIALEGNPRSIAQVLEILPDPLDELSINLGNGVCDMRANSAKYAIARAARHVLSVSAPLPEYTMTFLVKPDGARFEMRPTPPLSMVSCRTLHFIGTCSSVRDLSELTKLTSAAEFTDYAMPVAPSLTVKTGQMSPTCELDFHPMGFNWPAAVLVFRQYLESRNAFDVPVKLLKIHTRSALEFSIFKDQWLTKEGLTEIALEKV